MKPRLLTAGLMLVLFSAALPLSAEPAPAVPEAKAGEEATLQALYETLADRKYSEAEKAARLAIEQYPERIEFYVCLDQALNGQKRYEEAEAVRNQILTVWTAHYKEEFLEAGMPIRLRTWARMVTYTPGFIILSCEYFMPEELGDEEPKITNYYKFIVHYGPNPQDVRIFKLEHSNIIADYYVIGELSDAGHRQVVSFGSQKPTLQDATAALVQKLKEEVEK